MPSHRIKNILFDLGNTLIFYDYSYFYDGLGKIEKKLNIVKLKKYIRDNNLGNKLCKGKISFKDFFKRVKKKFNLKVSFDDFAYLYSDIFWVNNKMKNFLEKINALKQFRLFLISNTDSTHMNFLVKNFPFIKIFKNRILSYKIGMIKPQKKIFIYTLQKYNLKKEETLLIDDLPVNVKAAESLGIKAIRYKTHEKFLKQFTRIVRK